MTKNPVRPLTREELLRRYPVEEASVPGWAFRVQEVSASRFVVEGSDIYGRQVSREGTDAGALLRHCCADANAIRNVTAATPHPNPPPQGGRGLDRAIERLRAAGLDDPARDARLLERHAENETIFGAMIERRAVREPVSHILGRREFWSLDFAVTRACLDPRPDSETVVEAVLSKLADWNRGWRILDLGTGSGCLLLALLSELPNATGLGVDKSPEALAVALGNARRLGLVTRARFEERDWMCELEGVFDVVVSNPPYIPTAEVDALQPEVALYEPRMALDGGRDGLDAYRAIIPSLARRLAPGGLAALEIGVTQAAVEKLARKAGFATECRADLGGRDRCLILTRP